MHVLHRGGRGVVSTVCGSPLCVGDTRFRAALYRLTGGERECGRSSTGQSASHLLSDGVESAESGIGRIRLESRVAILSGSQTLLQGWH